MKHSLMILFLLAGATASGQTGISAEGLRSEYLVDPLGIDVQKPRLSWIVLGRNQSAYQVVVTGDAGTLWDSGKVQSAETTFIPYAGKPLASGMRCSWKVRVWDARGRPSPWSKPATWSMGLLKDSDWRAEWIGGEGPAFPWLRKTVTLGQRPRRATAYVNALGYYELYINGKKVDDHVLSPAVSDYSKRNLYVTHDVTSYLVRGRNCVALWLGRGWYVKGHPGVIHDGPLVRMQIDGPGLDIATDGSWKVKESPLTPLGRGTAFGDYGGERYDAGLELRGWNAADLDDSGWKPARVFTPPPAITAAQMVQPNRVMETLAAAGVQESAGAFLIDMGRNYTGWLEVPLPADTAAGKTIRLEYADILPSGPRFASYNQRDEYVTRSGPGQVIRSRFNYHAFRYARVTGLGRPPVVGDIKGYLIHTAYDAAGDFECSNDLLNRIYQTVRWTYRCLTLGGYVADCPHRERLGYGGDAGTSMETGMFNFDAGGLYNRWSANWRDAQAASGDLPYTAPAYPDQGGGGPMWSGFSITMPWQLYLQYGDKRALETNYPTMQRFLAFLETKTVDGILEPYVSYGIKMPQWNYLGDWVTPRRPPQGSGPRDPVAARFINNCYYLYNLQLAAKIAAILGHEDHAAMYRDKAGALKKALHNRFYNAAAGTYATGEQPYLAFPLLVDIVPKELRQTVMRNLEQTILTKNSGHLDSGMHGTYFMLRWLMQADRNDLIYEMAAKRTYPGWGYMLDQGATTIWENWSGGSHIHDTLISIGAWFTEGIGGIRADEKAPGFKHFFIQPGVAGGLTYARTRYQSIHGTIMSDWRIEKGELHLDVTVPAGTTATVLMPEKDGRKAFHVESGRHQFVSKLR